jgi:cytochrome P450
MDMREQAGSEIKLVRRTVSLGVALHEVIGQVTFEASFKQMNPLYQAARKLTGIKNFTEYQTKIVENCERIRNFIADYVMKRKNGEIKSQVPDGADLLSLFLKNDDVFGFDDTVDELIDFFGAATQTTQFGLQTLTSQLANKPEVLQKIRTEFK